MSRVTFVLTSSTLGGAELFTIRLAQGLLSDETSPRSEVRVVGQAGSPVLEAARRVGVDTTALDLGEKLGSRTAFRNALRFRTARSRLDEFMREAPDDLFVFQFKWEELLWGGRHSQHRVVLLEHGPIPKNLLRVPFARSLTRRALSRAKIVFAVSPPAADAVKKLTGREPKTLLAGIDTEAAEAAHRARSATRDGLGISPEVRNLLFLGRVTEDKGILDCVRLVGRIENSVLTVCGEGPAVDAGRALAGDLDVDDRVNWVGWTDRPYDMIAAADVLLLFSSSPGEGRPLTVLEAMSVGTPTVGLSSSPALAAMAGDGAVELVESGAPEAAVPVVERVLSAERVRRVERTWVDTARSFQAATVPEPAPEVDGEGWRSMVRAYGSVVMLSTADIDAPLWTNKQHIAVRLAEEVPVLYIESLGLRRPRFSARDAGRIARRLGGLAGRRKSAVDDHGLPEKLTVVSPVVIPFHSLAPVRAINRWLFRLQASRQIEALPGPKLLWVYSPLASSILDVSRFDAVLFHCVDDLATVPGIPGALVSRLELETAAMADVVVTTAPPLFARLSEVNPRTFEFHNVVDVEHFRRPTRQPVPPADLAAIPAPRALFFGALSDHKVDWGLVRDLAALRTEWSFVFIGPMGEEANQTELSEAIAMPNVFAFGRREYDSLPAYAWASDVGIVPYRVTEHTRSVFPMKVLEYRAAGLPVVATPLPGVADAVAQGLSVELATSAEEFSAALDRSGSEDPDVYVERHTWDTLFQRILAALAQRGN